MCLKNETLSDYQLWCVQMYRKQLFHVIVEWYLTRSSALAPSIDGGLWNDNLYTLNTFLFK